MKQSLKFLQLAAAVNGLPSELGDSEFNFTFDPNQPNPVGQTQGTTAGLVIRVFENCSLKEKQFGQNLSTIAEMFASSSSPEAIEYLIRFADVVKKCRKTP